MSLRLSSIFSASVFASLLLAACSDGGSSQFASGIRCPSSLNPVPMELDQKDNEKMIDLKGTTADLPAGIYTFNGADVFYRDNVSGMMMLYSDRKASGATEYSAKLECVRNYEMIQGFDVNAKALSGMTVHANGETLIDLRSYRIAFEGKERVVDFKDGDKAQNQIPSKPYADNKASDFFMIKMDDKNTAFEIRSKFPVIDATTKIERGALFILTRLKREDLATP